MVTTSPPDEKELLASYLAERDAPCPRCGYNLRTLQSNRCPECGEEVRLTVGLVYPKLGWFLTGLIGLATGFGFSALLLLGIVIHFSAEHWHRSPEPSIWCPVLGGMIVEGLMLVGYLRNAHRIRAAGTSARVALAMACWAASVLNIVVFSSLVR